MAQILIPVLTFLSVALVGAAVLTGAADRKRRLQARLRSEPDLSRPAAYQGQRRLFGMLGLIGGAVSGGGHSRPLRENLAKAGYHNSAGAAIYLGAKMILLIAGLIVALAVLIPMSLPFPAKAVLVLLLASTLFFLPNMVVYVRQQRRRKDIRHHLPDAIDLLEICVSSGMGLEMAWNMVSDEVRGVSPHLADEMALTNLEIHLGASRVVAMRHMAHRSGAEELGSLVAVLAQSERFGTSIADALRTFAASMREARSARAEEDAERTAVKLLFPMVLLIFPAMLIVIVGPASIRFAELLLNG